MTKPTPYDLTDKEFTYLLYDLIIGFCHLQNMNIWHGKFSLDWIARTTTGYAVMEDPLFGLDDSSLWKNDYNPSSGRKVHDSAASFGMKTAGEDFSGNDQQAKKFIRKPSKLKKIDLRTLKEVFFSPEAYRFLTEKNSNSKFHVIKSDVYSLGLVLLRVGLLQNINEIYTKNGICEKSLAEKLDKLKKKYP